MDEVDTRWSRRMRGKSTNASMVVTILLGVPFLCFCGWCAIASFYYVIVDAGLGKLPLAITISALILVAACGIVVTIFFLCDFLLLPCFIAFSMCRGTRIGTFSLKDKAIIGHMKYVVWLVLSKFGRKSWVDGISLVGCEMTQETAMRIASSLKGNSALKTFQLDNVQSAKSLDDQRYRNLGTNPIPEEVSINMNFIVKEIAESLRGNTTLVSLSLANNCGVGITRDQRWCRIQIHGVALAELAKTLETNTALKSLSLRRDFIGDNIRALAQMLRKNKALVTLDISENSLVTGGTVFEFAHALAENKTLEHLILSDTQTTSDGASAIAKSLEENSSLKTLDLSSNQIDTEGTLSLARMLKTNKTLATLDISNAGDMIVGAFEIAEALKINTTLKRLCLNHHAGILPAGMLAIAGALVVNTTLECLELLEYHNTCRADFILEAIAWNRGLLTLDIVVNSPLSAETFVNSLHMNETLKYSIAKRTDDEFEYSNLYSGTRPFHPGLNKLLREVRRLLGVNLRQGKRSQMFANVRATPDCSVDCWDI